MSDMIVKAVSRDRLAGYDQFNQFVVGRAEGSVVTYTFKRNLIGHTCSLCGKQWEATAASLWDQTKHRGTEQDVHVSCLRRVNSFTERQALIKNLHAAHIHDFTLKELPNGYWPRDDHEHVTPWYEVGLKVVTNPVIICGWRKSVYSLLFGRLTQAQHDALEAAFADVKDTKWSADSPGIGYGIHAWKEAQVVSYLETFARVTEAAT